MAMVAQRIPKLQAVPDIAERWGGQGMPALAVLAVSQGLGKTAFAAHVAVQAGRAGTGPVAMLDASPNRSLSNWKARRKRPFPEIRHTTFGDIRGSIRELEHEQTYAVCVVDLPQMDGAESASLRDAVTGAQLAVILSPPSGAALEKATAMAEELAHMRIRAAIVLAGMTQERDFWDSRAFSLRRRGLLLPAAFHLDDAVANAMSHGMTANEIDADCIATADIEKLWPLLQQIMSAPSEPRARRGERTRPATRIIAVAAHSDRLRAGIAANLAVVGGRGDDGGVSATLFSARSTGPMAQWAATRGGHAPTLRMLPADGSGNLRKWIEEPGTGLCVIETSPEELRRSVDLREAVDQILIAVRAADISRQAHRTRDYWPHEPAYILMRGDEDPGVFIGARNALNNAGCILAGSVSSGPEIAGSFGNGSTVAESHPASRPARDLAELWARIRLLMARR